METEMESHKRRRTVEGEIEEERFLFLGSEFNLFCIDLKKTEEKYGGKCSELSYDPPLVEVAWSTNIHATSNVLPLGMASTRFNFKTASSPSSRVLLPCSTTSDSNLLLIGGELQDPSAPYCSTHASREVYKLIPEVSGPNGDIKDIRIELADATIPRMKSGKACPIVEEIGDSCSLGLGWLFYFAPWRGWLIVLLEVPTLFLCSVFWLLSITDCNGDWRVLPSLYYHLSKLSTSSNSFVIAFN